MSDREQEAKRIDNLPDCKDGGARHLVCLGCVADYVIAEREKAVKSFTKKLIGEFGLPDCGCDTWLSELCQELTNQQKGERE